MVIGSGYFMSAIPKPVQTAKELVSRSNVGKRKKEKAKISAIVMLDAQAVS
jgi:hypothetical protein